MAEAAQLDFLIDGGELGSWVVSCPRLTLVDVRPHEQQPAAASSLAERLYQLGLPRSTRVAVTRNRVTMLSWIPSKGVRLHAGYAQAPDHVLAAIVTFLRPRVPRSARFAARRAFMAFPVLAHAPPSVIRRSRPRRIDPSDQPIVDRLQAEHARLNRLHFGSQLGTIHIALSHRMYRRLGELHQPRDAAAEIILSHRHLRRDGWPRLLDTLLHEMVHQWQAETGRKLGHGADFRGKAREVGIPPRAVG